MSSSAGLVGCRPTLDSGDVEFFVLEAGASPTEGAEPYEERTYRELPSTDRTW
jgi:hypothetical protein